VVLLRQRAQRLRQNRNRGGVDRQLTARRSANEAFNADQIADVEQTHDAERVAAQQIPMAEDLDFPRGVVQIDEHAAVAHRSDTPGDAHRILGLGSCREPGVALLELARLVRPLEAVWVGVDAARLEALALADPDIAQRVLRGSRLGLIVGHGSASPLRKVADAGRSADCCPRDRAAREIDNGIVETPQGAVMADADDRRPPRRFPQQPV
jgi:hypothetical protein